MSKPVGHGVGVGHAGRAVGLAASLVAVPAVAQSGNPAGAAGEAASSAASSAASTGTILLDVAAGVGAGPREALAFGITAAALAAGALAIVCAVAAVRKTSSRSRSHRQRIAALETELAEVRGLSAGEPQVLLRWRGAADPDPQLEGGLKVAGIPAEADGVANFSGWLDRDSAANLDAAVRDLRSVGSGFNLFVTTAGGERLIAEGFASAGAAVLKLRPLAGSSLEAVANADRYEGVEQDLASLKAILAKAPVLVWVRGRDGALRWVNQAYAAAVDAESPETVLTGSQELIGPETRKRLAETLAKGGVARQRVHAVTAGTRRAFDVIDVPAPHGDSGMAIDVSDVERLSDELERHVAAHARTLDQLATAVAIFGPDQTLTFFNAAYVNLWGLDETWLAQKPKDGEILDALRDQGRLPEQADYRSWRNGRLRIYTSIEPTEDWWHLPDGQSLRVVVEPHSIGGVTHLYENVTEKLSLASRYNTLFSVQRETLDNLHEGVALFGSDGRLKLSNPSFATIWKLKAQELENEPHMDAVIAACQGLTDDDEHWTALRASIGAMGGEREPISGRLTRPDGVVVEYASVPLPDGATLFTYDDVSDSWRIEQALRERNEALLAADRLKTAFISHVSYELRAPLTNIIGFADMLASQIFGPVNRKQAEYVGYIQQSSEKLHHLINDILDLATIDAGVMELDTSEVDVGETLRATAALLNERIEAAGLHLAYSIAETVGTIVADEKRVKQIIYNLLTNAIGFSPPGSTITLGARRDAAAVEISVGDQGPGIAPHMIDRVFERFVSHTDGSNHRGSGLGLSVVKSFVELHGGTIALDSTPGEGTTVRLRFPVDGVATDMARPAAVARLAVSPALPAV